MYRNTETNIFKIPEGVHPDILPIVNLYGSSCSIIDERGISYTTTPYHHPSKSKIDFGASVVYWTKRLQRSMDSNSEWRRSINEMNPSEILELGLRYPWCG